MTVTSTAPDEGLRERKKRRTREAIVAAALRLFRERGFDAVTVAEIARAADVSEKTVFNHFPAKEDLVFEHGRERLMALAEALRARPAHTPILAVFRDNTMAFVRHVERAPAEDITAVPRVVMGSRVLQERLILLWEREAQVLAPIIAEQTGAAAGDVVPVIAARALAWTHRTIVREGFERLLAGEDSRRVARDLREKAERAYALLEGGLATYGA